MSRAVVAGVRTRPMAVLEDVARVMDLAGLDRVLQRSCPTILKDNISWHLFYPSSNTTPWQLEGAILTLRAHGFGDLLAVHNRTVVTNTRRGLRLNRLAGVYQRYGVPQKFNYRPEDISWEVYRPRRRTPALERVYPDGIRIPREFLGTNIVHLPTMKCHVYTTTTGAMKNAFGGLLNTRRHYTHSHIHRTLVDLLIIQQEIHSGLFALMDGTFAGDGPGPRTLRPVRKDVLLASADQVAIDAVAAKLMGFDPMSIGYIRMAHDEGLGCGDPRDIRWVGDDFGGESWGFSVGDNAASRAGDLLWFGKLKFLQKLFFHTPLVWFFVAASYVYHDFIWYPLRSGRVLREFSRSDWGALFESRYGPGGSLRRATVR